MYVCTNNTHQWHLADEGMQSFVGYVVNKYFTCTFQVISPPPCHSITIDQSLMIDNLISMGRGEGCSRILALTDQLFGILFYSHSVGFIFTFCNMQCILNPVVDCVARLNELGYSFMKSSGQGIYLKKIYIPTCITNMLPCKNGMVYSRMIF